ncbi:FmdB family zinc ribbon protein [Krasilnikovia sp. M28-CT-15]|uniref:FmdB family zinc ribbon protein n=1 Tax=Krasilnikovia sp. M28-CT-15 TaxID=3373540 RepID=UPI003876E992
MPTYQYACTECGEQLEAVQSFSDPALTECPACQGKLRKVFNSVGIVFKGSGFYRNDSRSGNGGAGKSTTSDATKSDAAKSDATKSDSAKSSAAKSGTESSSSSSAASAGSSSSSAPAAASA